MNPVTPEETASMIGEVSIKPNAQATAEESDRILRRYSNDSLRKENEALKAAALELCDSMECETQTYEETEIRIRAAEARLRELVGLKPMGADSPTPPEKVSGLSGQTGEDCPATRDAYLADPCDICGAPAFVKCKRWCHRETAGR